MNIGQGGDTFGPLNTEIGHANQGSRCYDWGELFKTRGGSMDQDKQSIQSKSRLLWTIGKIIATISLLAAVIGIYEWLQPPVVIDSPEIREAIERSQETRK